MPIDKFQLAATVDHLIYGDSETFNAEDATALLAAMPRPSWRRFLPGISLKTTSQGKSRQGFAAGFGNVSIRDSEKRLELDTRNAMRVGQWKLYRGLRHIIIEQVASNAMDDQRSAALRFSWRWVPVRMDLLVSTALPLSESWIGCSISKYRPWKVPIMSNAPGTGV